MNDQYQSSASDRHVTMFSSAIRDAFNAFLFIYVYIKVVLF